VIARAAAFLLLLYGLGFALFSVTLATPAEADAPKAQAIVVITGGPGRIERGIDLMARGEAKRMLIAGADPLVTKDDLVRRVGGKRKLFRCCVDLGSESVDTRSNAEEARRWLTKRNYSSLRLVTSDWHMRRANYEFRRALDKRIVIVPDAVRTEPGLMTLFAEYNKYLLRRISVGLDI
jgi:uncharacterized SAM-binding protein YcdF (DUF218 family)